MELQSEGVADSVDEKPSHSPPPAHRPSGSVPLIAVSLEPTLPALLKALSDTEREAMKTRIEKRTTQLCSAPKHWQSYPRERERADRRSFQPFLPLTISFLP